MNPHLKMEMVRLVMLGVATIGPHQTFAIVVDGVPGMAHLPKIMPN